MDSMITAHVPASCGELVQGMLDEQDFIINCPISLKTEVSVSLNSSGAIKVLSPLPSIKVAEAAILTLGILKAGNTGVEITIRDPIPRGKGLASSTSELAATIRAIAFALDRPISDEDFSRIIIEVDHSTDGLYWPGIVRCNQLKGKLHESLGLSTSMRFIIVDTGGAICTETFDRQAARAVARTHERTLRQAVYLVTEGLKQRKPHLVGKGATLSAQVNQHVLPKLQLEEIIVATREFGALGVNCAHTGTVLGVMYQPESTDADILRKRVEALVGSEAVFGDFALESGHVSLTVGHSKKRPAVSCQG